MLELSATLRPGDSGSALANGQGEVVGIAFAIARDTPNVAYALTPSDLQKMLETAGTTAVSTGPCLT